MMKHAKVVNGFSWFRSITNQGSKPSKEVRFIAHFVLDIFKVLIKPLRNISMKTTSPLENLDTRKVQNYGRPCWDHGTIIRTCSYYSSMLRFDIWHHLPHFILPLNVRIQTLYEVETCTSDATLLGIGDILNLVFGRWLFCRPKTHFCWRHQMTTLFKFICQMDS